MDKHNCRECGFPQNVIDGKVYFPHKHISGFILYKLQIGDKIKKGDWCFDIRSNQPVETVRNSPHTISKTHHPYFRIIKLLKKRTK